MFSEQLAARLLQGETRSAPPRPKGGCDPGGKPERSTQKETIKDKLNVLQWNGAGWQNEKITQVSAAGYLNDVDVILAQDVRTNATPEGFVEARVRRNRHGGGAAVFVRQELKPRLLRGANVRGVDVASATLSTSLGSSITFTSIYATVDTALTPDVLAAAMPPQEQNNVIGADFNAHTALWCPTLEDDRGTVLEEWAAASGLSIGADAASAEPCPTRHAKGNRDTAPDVTMYNGCFVENWTATPSYISDHFFILYQVSLEEGEFSQHDRSDPGPDSFYSYQKADWARYGEVVTEKLMDASACWKDVNKLWSTFVAALQEAAARSVPRGKFSPRDQKKPNMLNQDGEYRRLCAAIEQEKAENNDQQTLFHLAAQRRQRAATVIRTAWEQRVSRMHPGDSSSWKLLKSVLKERSKSVCATEIAGETDNAKKAEVLLRQYFGKQTNKSCLPRLRSSRRNPVSAEEVKHAVRLLKNRKAAGTSGIVAEFLKHLPDAGMKVLIRLVHMSITRGEIPQAWKFGTVVPLYKDGKDPSKPASWRPVCLCEVTSKVAERVIAERLVRQIHLSDAQFGFRHGRETTDAVYEAVDHIIDSFNQYEDIGRPNNANKVYFSPSRISATFFDLTQAFDRVTHTKLLQMLRDRGVDSTTLRWIRNFLSRRKAVVRVRPKTSRRITVWQGVPQGTILGPILFAVYIDPLLRELQQTEDGHRRPGMVTGFADDVSTFSCGSTRSEASRANAKAIRIFRDYCDAYDMEMSTKTVSLIFFRYSRGYHSSRRARMLGAHLDPQLSMSEQMSQVTTSVNFRIRQLRRISAAFFGPTTHSLRCFYKAYIESKLLYAAESWWPLLSDSQKEALDVLQKKALRIVAGLVGSAKCEDLYIESGCQPISVIVRTRMAEYYERALRLPPDDRRNVMMTREIRDHAQDLGNYQESFYTKPLTLHFRELAGRVPALLPREPLFTSPVIPTEDAAFADRVEINVAPRGPLPVVYVPGEEDEITARKQKWCYDTYDALMASRPKPPTLRAATDASVSKEGTSAGTCNIYMGRDDHPLPDDPATDRRTGTHTCSFRAESLTLLRGLRRISRLLPPSASKQAWIVLLTDSNSSLDELARGPLTFHVAGCAPLIWQELLSLAKRGYRVVLQFVYAHCGFSFNERADSGAKALDRDLPRPDDSPVWIYDAVRAIMKDHPDKLKVRKPSRVVPRGPAVRLARLRTEGLDLGIFLRRIKFVESLACRWCCPDLHNPVPEQPTSKTEYAADAGGEDDGRYPSNRPQTCPECAKVLSTKKSLRSHMKTQHNLELPSQRDPNRERLQKTRNTARAVVKRTEAEHARPSVLSPQPPGVMHGAPQPLPEGVPLEDLPHVLLRCPALEDARRTSMHTRPSVAELARRHCATDPNEIPAAILDDDDNIDPVISFMDLAQRELRPHLQHPNARTW